MVFPSTDGEIAAGQLITMHHCYASATSRFDGLTIHDLANGPDIEVWYGELGLYMQRVNRLMPEQYNELVDYHAVLVNGVVVVVNDSDFSVS